MSALNPTPPERLVDAHGQSYYLWDKDLALGRSRELLATGDEATRLHFRAKLMRQAKPDDVITLVREATTRERRTRIETRWGCSRASRARLLARSERK